MAISHQIGHVIYVAHTDMKHGIRPSIVMGETEDHLMVMPLSSSNNWMGRCSYVSSAQGCNAHGWCAPNRVTYIQKQDAPAPAGVVSWDSVMGAWDDHEEYQAWLG